MSRKMLKSLKTLKFQLCRIVNMRGAMDVIEQGELIYAKIIPNSVQ